jgi:hypothetical protein
MGYGFSFFSHLQKSSPALTRLTKTLEDMAISDAQKTP